MIQTFLAIEGLGLSDQVFGTVPTDGIQSKTSEAPKTTSNGGEVGADVCDASPLTRRGQTDGSLICGDEPASKLQKIDGQGVNSTAAIGATEDAILELVEGRNGVRHLFFLNFLRLEFMLFLVDDLSCCRFRWRMLSSTSMGRKENVSSRCWTIWKAIFWCTRRMVAT